MSLWTGSPVFILLSLVFCCLGQPHHSLSSSRATVWDMTLHQHITGSHHFEATEWPPIAGPKCPRRFNICSCGGFCIDMMIMLIWLILLDNNRRRGFMAYGNCLLSEILRSSERAGKDRSGKFFIKVKRIWLLEKVWKVKKNGFLSFSSI